MLLVTLLAMLLEVMRDLVMTCSYPGHLTQQLLAELGA